MLGVLAFFFVDVCLVTSPTKEITIKVPVIVPETTANTEESTIHSIFVETLSDEEIMEAVAGGVNYLKNCESYRAHIETRATHSTRENAVTDYAMEVYRYGDDKEEQRYSFNADGMLVWYQRLFYNEDGEEILDSEVEVYRTAEGETRQKIDSIPVS